MSIWSNWANLTQLANLTNWARSNIEFESRKPPIVWYSVNAILMLNLKYMLFQGGSWSFREITLPIVNELTIF